MSYVGDINLGDTIDVKFTTRQISGAPFTLAGSPVISAYVGNSTTELTAGITLSVDFDSRTGLNNVRVVATSGNGYATASNYQLVITTGSVNSVSVVGEVVAEFSIEARSAGLKPTVAGRTLDVSSTGEAGVDWANVGSPTTAVDLSGTTIKTTQKVDVDTIKTGAVVNGGTITFPTNATLASTTNITAGTITTATTVTAVTGLTAATVHSDLDDIQARLPAALTAGGNMKSDMLASNGDTTAAANVAKTTRAIGRGTCAALGTTTSVITSAFTPSGAAADQFKGRIITFDADTTTTALRGQSTDITASTNAATPTFTVTALTTAPVSGDTFSVT